MQKLWFSQDIPIIGVSGAFDSGKTTFLLDIAPLEGKTLLYDLEMSAATYEQWYPNMTRVDLPAMAAVAYPNGYTEKQLFELWHKHLKSVKAGEYNVIAVDTLDALEIGLEELIASQYKKYNSSSPESMYAHGKIWRIFRTEWNKLLLGEIATKCETFAFATHLKTIWKNDRPTKEKAPAGKDVLLKLTSLYLVLERDAAKGQIIPSAQVLKSRLRTMVGGKLQPLLPFRLPEGTPAAIRKYIGSPPDFLHLTDGEKITEKILSEDEKLIIQAEIAAAKQATAEAEVAAAETAERTEQARERARARLANKVNTETTTQIPKDTWMELLQQAQIAKKHDDLVNAMVRDAKVTNFSNDIFDILTRSHYDGYVATLEKVQVNG